MVYEQWDSCLLFFCDIVLPVKKVEQVNKLYNKSTKSKNRNGIQDIIPKKVPLKPMLNRKQHYILAWLELKYTI